MELDFTLNRKQQGQLNDLTKFIGQCSWVLHREQGTGLKFWRIVWTEEADWQGEQYSTDGRTLNEVIENVKAWVREHREYE